MDGKGESNNSGKKLLFLVGSIVALVVAKNPELRDGLWRFLDQLAREAGKRAVPPPRPASLPPPTSASLQDSLGSFLPDINGKAASAASTEMPTFIPPVDMALTRLIDHPSIIVILGHRGSGKTALAFRTQELLRDVAPPYAVGLPAKASDLLPDWYGLTNDVLTVPPNATVYIPESYRLFHARTTQSALGRAVGDLISLSRHRRFTLIFDVQNPAHLDRNIISEADVVLIKELGPLQQGFERVQLKPMMDSARAALAGVGRTRRKQVLWAVARAKDVDGQLMENVLPTFWSESLSRIFGGIPPMAGATNVPVTNARRVSRADDSVILRRGKKTPTDVLREKVKQMAPHYSLGEIGKTLG